jgi:hypothetical protein
VGINLSFKTVLDFGNETLDKTRCSSLEMGVQRGAAANDFIWEDSK